MIYVTFKDYFEQLKEIYEKYPDAQLIYRDSETDDYSAVLYLPVEGFWDNEKETFIERSKKVNVICLT